MSLLSLQGLSALRLTYLALIVLGFAYSTRAAPTDGALLAERADPAGLAWGPVPIGPYIIGVTNPHEGEVPLKYADVEVMHTNVRVWQKVKNTNKSVLNFHVVPEVLDGKRCWYVYESKTKTVVLDEACDSDWPAAFAQMTQAINNALEDFFNQNNVSLLARIAIIAETITALSSLAATLAAGAIVAAAA